MDPLSRLVALLDPRGRMDLRCLFGQAWSAPHAAIGPWRAPFHIVLRGECELLLTPSRKALRLGPGSLLLLPRGAAHELRGAGGRRATPIRSRGGELLTLKTNLRRPAQADVEILCGELEFTGRRRSVLLEALPEALLVEFGRKEEFAWLESLVQLMSREIAQDRPGAAAIVAELSGTLFTLALRAHLEAQAGLVGVLGLLANPRLGPALQAMLDEPQKDWTVESLARRCNLSRAGFAREFSRHSALAPLQLLTALRMELAAQLLARGGQDTASSARRWAIARRRRSTAPSRALPAPRPGASGARERRGLGRPPARRPRLDRSVPIGKILTERYRTVPHRSPA
jgi:AraC family transcriptional activator of mtrCDE